MRAHFHILALCLCFGLTSYKVFAQAEPVVATSETAIISTGVIVGDQPVGCAPTLTPGCPDTRILDCAGREVGAIECNLTMGQSTETDPVSISDNLPIDEPANETTDEPTQAAAAGCPTFVAPTCRADQELIDAPISSQFQVAGCPTTMPLCKALAEADDTTPSTRCGASQSFSQASGRCENTDTACQPFLRFCERGESPNQLCSCSPTKASVEGPRACVAMVSCPDTRVLNCDATRQSSVRNCTVAAEVEDEDSDLFGTFKKCLKEYETLRKTTPLPSTIGNVSGGSFIDTTGPLNSIIIPDINGGMHFAGIDKYAEWNNRCGGLFGNAVKPTGPVSSDYSQSGGDSKGGSTGTSGITGSDSNTW